MMVTGFTARAKEENRTRGGRRWARGPFFVYVMAASPAEARRIGRAAVGERLAACANILPGLRSIYWWEGKVAEGRETVLVLKTRAARLDALIARVRALHSYECPAIVALPIVAGSKPYLDWIAAETAAPTQRTSARKSGLERLPRRG